MFEDTLDLADLDNKIYNELQKSLSNLKGPKEKFSKPGHYIILSNRETPKDAINHSMQMPYEDKFIWYNGTASKSIGARINSHLFRSSKYKSASGIKVEHISIEEFEKNVPKTQGQNFTLKNNRRYLQGINITEEKWNDYQFWIATVETKLFDTYIERIFKQKYGNPPLAKYTER